MKFVKPILRTVNVLNILLLVTALFLFFEFDYPLLNRGISVEQIEAKEPAIQNEEKIVPETSVSYADFITIAEKNLFHPEREMPKAENAAVPKPELILYGTLITDEVSIAYVEDKKTPYSTPGRAKRQTALKKGNSISGYVLREIEPNRIVLVRGEDKLVVNLDDKTEKRRVTETGVSQSPRATSGPFSPSPMMPAAAAPAPSPPPPPRGAFSVPVQGVESPASQPGTRRPGAEMLRSLRPQSGAAPQ